MGAENKFNRNNLRIISTALVQLDDGGLALNLTEQNLPAAPPPVSVDKLLRELFQMIPNTDKSRLRVFLDFTIDENGNIIPSATGKDLGSSDALWDAFLQDLNQAGSSFFSANSPAQITAAQNNYALPSNTSMVRLSSDASRTITGFLATNNNNRFAVLINVGAQNLVLAHQSSSSDEANRIISPFAADFTIAANESVVIWYDPTTARWRIL